MHADHTMPDPMLSELVDWIDQTAFDFGKCHRHPPLPPEISGPFTTVVPVLVPDPEGRGYELVVRQDSETAEILGYRLRRRQ